VAAGGRSGSARTQAVMYHMDYFRLSAAAAFVAAAGAPVSAEDAYQQGPSACEQGHPHADGDPPLLVGVCCAHRPPSHRYKGRSGGHPEKVNVVHDSARVRALPLLPPAAAPLPRDCLGGCSAARSLWRTPPTGNHPLVTAARPHKPCAQVAQRPLHELAAQQGAPQRDLDSRCVRINTAYMNAATCSGPAVAHRAPAVLRQPGRCHHDHHLVPLPPILPTPVSL